MGRHVNELRRNTTNDSLAKRAKELVKKWRSLVLPDSNGQLKPAEPQIIDDAKTRKRLPKEKLEHVSLKRSRVNGTNELDFSDNSNSSFKDVISSVKAENKRDIILINSDSNSSFLDGKNDPILELQQPKKRGRKKGSKNHRNLLDEAETSFSNKMAVSRGNAKVKTTQELIASLQNKSSSLGVVGQTKPKEDLMEKAAKLTERVSIIDQKLNTSGNRYKNSQKRNSSLRNESRVIESGTVTNIERSPSQDKSHNLSSHTDDEIIVVDEETENSPEAVPSEKQVQPPNANIPKSLNVEDALALLPPIDKSCLYETDTQDVECTCFLNEHKSGDFSIEEEVEVPQHKFEFKEDCNCQAKEYLEDKYHLGEVTDDRVFKLHDSFVPGLNGNLSAGCGSRPPEVLDNGLYVNVVPSRNNESIPKCFHGAGDFSCEHFKKYSISEEGAAGGTDGPEVSNTVKCESTLGDDGDRVSEKGTFKEWHEVVETPSYNGEILKILPYVIID